MLRAAADSLGFSFEVLNPADRTWGRFDPKERRWTGKRALMLEGQVDLLVGGVAVTPGTVKVIVLMLLLLLFRILLLLLPLLLLLLLLFLQLLLLSHLRLLVVHLLRSLVPLSLSTWRE